MNKSPTRHTFQKESYIKRREKEGREPNPDYLKVWENLDQIVENIEQDPEWQKNNLEYDLRNTPWICEKAKASENYAQNIYAALCNMEWLNLEVIKILKDERWSCSWRHAGGIVADMREEGDYIDWYCSGIGGGWNHDDSVGDNGYVPEGVVTEEIQQDFLKLGWVPREYED